MYLGPGIRRRVSHRLGLAQACLGVGCFLVLGCGGGDEIGRGEKTDPAPASETTSEAIVLDSIGTPIDFRATGNEPGWHLEIRDDLESANLKRIRFVYDYGEGEAVLYAPDPEVDPAEPKVTFMGRNGDLEIVVEVVNARCADTMSDVTFSSTVTVEFQGRVFHGCGGGISR